MPQNPSPLGGIWALPTLHKIDLTGKPIATETPSLAGLVNPRDYIAGPGGECLLIEGNNSEVVLRRP